MLSAAFDAQYAPIERSTRRALTLDTATNEPGVPASIIARANARITRRGPRVFTAITRSHSSTGRSRSIPECPTPAVTVTCDGAPTRAIVSATASSIDAGSVTSHLMSWSPAMSSTSASVPAARSASTTAAPIPDAPPTTTWVADRSVVAGEVIGIGHLASVGCYTSGTECNASGMSTLSPT